MLTFLDSVKKNRQFVWSTALVVGSFLALFSSVSAAERNFTLPPARVGMPYTYTFMADAGFTEPYIWHVTTSTVADVLPPGFSVAASGARGLVLRGTPSRVGTYQFTIMPVSASGTSLADTLVTLEVQNENAVPLIVNGTGMRAGLVGVPFSSDPILAVQGGMGPYEWRLVRGGLPSGLQLNAQGALVGTANDAGTYVFDAQVRDAAGFLSTTSVMITVRYADSSSSSSNASSSNPSTMTPSMPSTSTNVPSGLSSSDRWVLLNRLGISANSVVRSEQVDPLMQRTVLYYIGVDGRRHPFQNDKVYMSWYPSAAVTARSISVSDLASIPLGEIITYRPGERVRFQTDSMSYVVSEGRSLRRTDNQYSTSWTWQGGVEELDEADRGVYYLSDEVATPTNYDPATARARYMTPNDILPSS